LEVALLGVPMTIAQAASSASGPFKAAGHMATSVATTHNSFIKQFYERLLVVSKLKKVALVVCMRELLTTLNAMMRANKPFSFAVRGLPEWLDFEDSC
jgi:hypothetical protein